MLQLRDYQTEITKRAVEIIGLRSFVILMMEMRTGKTLTAFNIAKELNASNILFLTKKKAIDSILADAKKIGVNCTVINYEQITKYKKINFDLIIIDEFHNFGAFPKKTLRTTNMGAIAKDKICIFLSGTPTPESFSQIFHPLHVTGKLYQQYKNFYQWANDYVDIKKKFIYNRAINDYKLANENKILADLKDVSITYTQKDAGFRQVVEDIVLHVPMSNYLSNLIKDLKRDKVLSRPGKTILADTKVKEMQKVHQLCSGTILTEEGERIVLSTYKAKFIKSTFLGKKIAVFYKYIAEREALESVFDCTDSIEEFNTTDKVFVGQMTSAREGTNLSHADCLVMYNIDFSATTYLQVRQRLQSIAREGSAKVYWIFSFGIEDDIYNVVKNKQNFTTKHYDNRKRIFEN